MDLRLLSVATSLFAAILGVMVYLKGRKNPINLSFALFSWIGAFWSLSLYLYANPVVQSSAYWIKVVYLLCFPIISLPLFFSFVFPGGKVRYAALSQVIYYLASAPFLYCLLFTEKWILGVYPTEWGTETLLGPVYQLWGFFNLGVGLFIFGNLFRKYRKSEGLVRLQLKYIFLGIYILAAGTLLVDVFLPIFTGSSRFFWASSLFLAPFIAFTSYAIIRHRLMDIRLIIARSVSYAILLFIIAIFYVSSLFFVSRYLFPATMEANEMIISVVLALVIAFTFQPLRLWLERFTDKIFFRERYDSEEILGNLSRLMASTLELTDLGKGVVKELLKKMKISRGALVLFKNHRVLRIITVGFHKPFVVTRSEASRLVNIQNQVLVFEELQESLVKKLMRKLDQTTCLTLSTKDHQVGLLILGEKSSGDVYSNQDIEVLKIFAPQLAVAIQNAQAFEEIKNFSHTLEKKVDEATFDLKIANTKLKEMSALKDEFVSVASHELRAPMTTIKGYLSMVLEGDTGKVDKKTREFLENAYEGNERMIRLVNNMLNVSRIESGRLVISLEDIQIEDAIDHVVKDFQIEARDHGLKLNFVKPKVVLPKVRVDPDRIREVIANLVNNAIKFTAHGSVTVRVSLKKETVVVEVSDTGVGISPENQKKLFQKFSQVGGSKSAMEKGSGLGLYICRNLVEGFGGRVWLESVVGKGTSFFFSLPIIKN